MYIHKPSLHNKQGNANFKVNFVVTSVNGMKFCYLSRLLRQLKELAYHTPQ